MDKAIIFGIYDFVSFHIGNTLLNKGLEVIGIHLDETNQAPFLEEKRLEVGRNANFKEIALSELDEWTSEDAAIKTTLILSLYDFYMLNEEAILQNPTVLNSLQQYLERNRNQTEIVFVSPIQMLNVNGDQILSAFTNQVRHTGEDYRIFYLPAIYGPWQPSTFTFQQALLARKEERGIKVNQREWTRDILFVDDAVETILALMESQDNMGSTNILIESGKVDYWAQCAAQLQLDKSITDTIQSEPIELDSTIRRISVRKVTPFNDSINKQLEMVNRLT